jgi:hypothetical protein
LLSQGGIPNRAVISGGRISHLILEHLWTEAWVDFIPSRGGRHREGDSWIPLDASFKIPEINTGLEWQTQLTFNPEEIASQLKNEAADYDETGLTRLDNTVLQNTLDTQQNTLSQWVTNQGLETLGHSQQSPSHAEDKQEKHHDGTKEGTKDEDEGNEEEGILGRTSPRSWLTTWFRTRPQPQFQEFLGQGDANLLEVLRRNYDNLVREIVDPYFLLMCWFSPHGINTDLIMKAYGKPREGAQVLNELLANSLIYRETQKVISLHPLVIQFGRSLEQTSCRFLLFGFGRCSCISIHLYPSLQLAQQTQP